MGTTEAIESDRRSRKVLEDSGFDREQVDAIMYVAHQIAGAKMRELSAALLSARGEKLIGD